MGVGNAASAFLPAAVISRDSSGRNHQVVIPFNSAVKLVVFGSFFQITDTAGQPLSRTAATAIPLAVAAGQQPPAIQLRVIGAGQQ
jgi:hypothetical protein